MSMIHLKEWKRKNEKFDLSYLISSHLVTNTFNLINAIVKNVILQKPKATKSKKSNKFLSTWFFFGENWTTTKLTEITKCFKGENEKLVSHHSCASHTNGTFLVMLNRGWEAVYDWIESFLMWNVFEQILKWYILDSAVCISKLFVNTSERLPKSEIRIL